MLFSVFFAAFCTASIAACATDRLVQVQVVHRHGDRTPLESYPNDPYSADIFAEDLPGQLTNVGKERSYQLGQWLRQRYSQFLPTKYSYPDIRIVSDDTDRCLMSAYSELAGLYPPEGSQIWQPFIFWQPIPVHINISILEGTPTNCPAADKLQQGVFGSDKYQTILKANKVKIEQLQAKSGANLSDFWDLASLRDTMYIESLKGLSLPSWTAGLFPEPLNTLGAMFYGSLTFDAQMSKMTVGPLFYTILEAVETATEKMLIYSAHDTNVASIVNHLVPSYGYFCPEFSSAAVLEVWQQKTGKKYVKLFLKRFDKVEQLKIAGCGLNCDVTTLKKVLKSVLVTLEARNSLC